MNRYELLRYERGLQRRVVSEGSGVPLRTLQALETDEHGRPSAPTAKALADFYSMTVAEFLGLDQIEAA